MERIFESLEDQVAIGPAEFVEAPVSLAKDLLAELDAINAQIGEIMVQVERAVERLAKNC